MLRGASFVLIIGRWNSVWDYWRRWEKTMMEGEKEKGAEVRGVCWLKGEACPAKGRRSRIPGGGAAALLYGQVGGSRLV